MALGGTAAWWLAGALGASRPLFAALVPLLAMNGDPFAAVSVWLDRVLGVLAGVALGIGATHLDAGSTTRIALVLLVGCVAAMALRVGERPNLEVPIAALFVLAFASTDASRLGVQRIWETGLGAVVAIVVSSLLWPPDPVRELTRRLDRLRGEVVADLVALADALAAGLPSVDLEEVRAHSRDAVRDVFAIDDARRALRWSPIRRRDTAVVDGLDARLHLAARIARHARALARDVADTPVRDEALAAAARHLADAADRTLQGGDAQDALARSTAALDAPFDGDALIVAAQLRQLLTDMRQG